MMKPKVLFLCASYRSGGAERAFVSLLNTLPLDKLEAHIMTIEPVGLFEKQMPPQVIVEDAPKEMYGYISQFGSEFYKRNFHLYIAIRKALSVIKRKFSKGKEHLSGDQFFWKEARGLIPYNKNKYDAVIAFSAGFCCYYAIEKVNAPLKYLWVHNDYNKQGASAEFDRPYFEIATKVCTISDICVDALIENFPDLKDKFVMVENVSPSSLIQRRSQEPAVDFCNDGYEVTFCSVGRFNPQKGYDWAMAAAKILKEKGLKFCWYIVGDGELRFEIEGMIQEYGLQNNVKLLGLRENPYTYIAHADIFVMTSRFEGKSIALDEAKILCKPILSTKYPSVFDNIKDGVNGILVDQTPESIADGLYALSRDSQLREKLSKYSRDNFSSNEEKVCKQIMDFIENK